MKMLWKLSAVALGLLLVAVAGAANLRGTPATATHQPADKLVATGTTFEEMEVQLVQGQSSKVVELLAGRMKTSSVTDLVFQLALECALVTNVKTVDDATSEAVATVRVWVEVDGNPVAVSSDDTAAGDVGKIVACNRAFRSATSGFDEVEGQQEIALFNRTKSAHSFNWVRLNLSNLPSPHLIKVKAQLVAEVTGVGQAEAAIGKRTLVVFPAKLANDASI